MPPAEQSAFQAVVKPAVYARALGIALLGSFVPIRAVGQEGCLSAPIVVCLMDDFHPQKQA
jgi:hypothetical protein